MGKAKVVLWTNSGAKWLRKKAVLKEVQKRQTIPVEAR
jgi:hypothetical protein